MRHVKNRVLAATMGVAALFSFAGVQPAAAQSEPYIGQLALFSYNFCPNGWADASGQILSIAQNTALFSLLGTTYGGNGMTTFALPDLRGRAPIHVGQAPGLPNYDLGQIGGTEDVTITVNNMPAHNHSVAATNLPANKGGPGGKFLGSDANLNKYSDTATPNVTMNSQMVGVTGGGQPFSVRDPYLAMRWCIAIYGIYPSRP
ncbi:phage tail protein [Sphingobium lactosutens]|uniref:phage tail protein n=1 Tax=Sphingobium lactosutens TaxID=522773 RepID=UPI0015C01F7A|nr:tail fiber protein [Sphingobium lactosutens]NWK97727.1 phage tail protein [Sphingobium lactosutens]